MTYTRPGDFGEGYIFSAADFNKFLRDNFMAAVPDIFEQAGDLAMGDASANAVRRHPKSGVVGELLTSMAGVLEWHRPYVTFGLMRAAEKNMVVGQGKRCQECMMETLQSI